VAKPKGAIPRSPFRRATQLLVAGAKIAAQEVGARASAALGASDNPLAVRVKQTQELVAALSRLKGAAMKGGQLLSIELSDVLPPEIVAVLRQLHDAGTTMPLAQVQEILSREIGAEKAAQIENLSTEPIASASIGQVHSATIAGRPVAIKVQFPGVAESIDSDLAVMRRIAESYLRLQGKKIYIEPVFQELAEGIRVEVDYLKEAANLQRYAAALRHPCFVVPRLEAEFSSSRVLVMSYEDGVRINNWLASKPSVHDRARFASLVLDLVVEEIMHTGLMQSDPNFGNFLYRPESGQLVLLDFGSTVEFSKETRLRFLTLVDAAMAGDEARLLELAHEYGYFDRRESPAVKADFLETARLIVGLFDEDRQPCHFADPEILRELRTTMLRFALGVNYSAPAQQLTFLGRKTSGMFHLLKELDAVVDLSQLLTKVEVLRGELQAS
jgi:aarF domain-containing kinase